MLGGSGGMREKSGENCFKMPRALPLSWTHYTSASVIATNNKKNRGLKIIRSFLFGYEKYLFQHFPENLEILRLLKFFFDRQVGLLD